MIILLVAVLMIIVIVCLAMFSALWIMYIPERTILGGENERENFVYVAYDINVDDQSTVRVKNEDQEYLHRDYTNNVLARFPLFSKDTIAPHIVTSDGRILSDPQSANAYLRNIIPGLKDIGWNNQTISYMRLSTINTHIQKCIIEPLIEKQELPNIFPLVDATGNIGGDSIGFALNPHISQVTTYEILSNVYDMLMHNVQLYGLEEKILCKNTKFDYQVRDAFLIIDPPYESGNNGDNFNLSIDKWPIYEVCNKALQEGALAVMITMPRTYQYNAQYAQDNNQHVLAYQMGKKNNKLFLVRKYRDAYGENFLSYIVQPNNNIKLKSGKTNPWNCVVDRQ